jgi:hypothetical protein
MTQKEEFPFYFKQQINFYRVVRKTLDVKSVTIVLITYINRSFINIDKAN